MFYTTKKYGHNAGLSCAFRQWRATHSHCSKMHGYAIAVSLDFAVRELDDKNWGVDFGSLKPIKQFLTDTFDHKTLIAADDPELDWFVEADKRGILDLVILPAVGCEKFAEHIGKEVEAWVDITYGDRISLVAVEVSEHEGNHASWSPVLSPY